MIDSDSLMISKKDRIRVGEPRVTKEFSTIKTSGGGYILTATQRIREGCLQEGYAYTFSKGIHVIDMGSVQCSQYSRGITETELITMFTNLRARC